MQLKTPLLAKLWIISPEFMALRWKFTALTYQSTWIVNIPFIKAEEAHIHCSLRVCVAILKVCVCVCVCVCTFGWRYIEIHFSLQNNCLKLVLCVCVCVCVRLLSCVILCCEWCCIIKDYQRYNYYCCFDIVCRVLDNVQYKGVCDPGGCVRWVMRCV